MATNTLISTVEYLRSGFDNPAPDYVDEELVERSSPNYLHNRTQVRLADQCKPWEDRRQLLRASEIRLCIAPERFRVADFAMAKCKQTTPAAPLRSAGPSRPSPPPDPSSADSVIQPRSLTPPMQSLGRRLERDSLQPQTLTAKKPR